MSFWLVVAEADILRLKSLVLEDDDTRSRIESVRSPHIARYASRRTENRGRHDSSASAADAESGFGGHTCVDSPLTWRNWLPGAWAARQQQQQCRRSRDIRASYFPVRDTTSASELRRIVENRNRK